MSSLQPRNVKTSTQQPNETQRRNLTTTIQPTKAKKGRPTEAKNQLIAAIQILLGRHKQTTD
ncbi:hypothetical protein ADU60_08515 [Vibrio coralliilyticus]|nr:hypothetical protein DVV14_02400 [Vibrio coralliilyticus]KPH25300.1 hypothetical protein ADU60_08515 [Vibrio coralliilyticus]